MLFNQIWAWLQGLVPFLNTFGPSLMVAGALISLLANIVGSGPFAVSLQWVSAAGLYTALLLRNIRK